MKEASLKQIFAVLASFLVVLVGSVIWGVLYAVIPLYVAACFIIITNFAAFLAYAYFKPNCKVGMFCYITVLSIVINYFAMILAAAIYTQRLTSGVTFGELFRLCMQVSLKEAVQDTLICTGFSFLGAILGYIDVLSLLKKNGGKLFVKKLKRNVKIEAVKMENGKIVDENFERILKMVTAAIKEQSITKDREAFLKELNRIKSSEIDNLEKDKLDKLLKECLNSREDKIEDAARKILLKLALKQD